MKYLTVNDCVTDTIIKKSKFITYVYHVSSGENAQEILKDLRKKHYDSTHICYGYIADIEGKDLRFSDDGEPGGTAGQPILDIIKLNNLRQTLIAVVRYFGGIKLGASGLTRAYSDCASSGVHASKIDEFILCHNYKLDVDFNLYQKFVNVIQYKKVKIQSTAFTNLVTMIISIPTDDSFLNYIIDWSCGKINPIFIDESYEKF